MIITAERREVNNCGLFEIPRYLYYMCLHMHCTRPCTPCKTPITSAPCALSFGTLAAVRSTILRSLPFATYMSDSASSSEDSPDKGSDLSRTRTATRQKKHPDDDSNLGCTRTAARQKKHPDNDSDLGRTRTATGHRKCSSSQTAAQRKERLAAE